MIAKRVPHLSASRHSIARAHRGSLKFSARPHCTRDSRLDRKHANEINKVQALNYIYLGSRFILRVINGECNGDLREPDADCGQAANDSASFRSKGTRWSLSLDSINRSVIKMEFPKPPSGRMSPRPACWVRSKPTPLKPIAVLPCGSCSTQRRRNFINEPNRRQR